MIMMQCGRCGSYLGMVETQAEAATKNKEHLQDCTVDFYSS